MENSPLDRSHPTARYRFTGHLIADTALHIGGERNANTPTDSPILRDGLGRPLIPGSSLKGAFRATVERLLPNLHSFKSCQLTPGYRECLSTNEDLGRAYRRVSEAVSRGRRLGTKQTPSGQEDAKALEQLGRPEWVEQPLQERHLLTLLDEHLCDTCKTFGSPYLAGVVFFRDLPVSDPWGIGPEIRDGVGIDRDSERARDQIKFDYEVVPAGTEFDLELTLEGPSQRDLGLVAIGLLELTQGAIPLGGMRSRGLGRCHLEDLRVASVDFTDSKALTGYLIKGWSEPEPKPAQPVLENWLSAALSLQETSDA
jgi:CRISPR-associated RAMP protein (TIGR02581 family)